MSRGQTKRQRKQQRRRELGKRAVNTTSEEWTPFVLADFDEERLAQHSLTRDQVGDLFWNSRYHVFVREYESEVFGGRVTHLSIRRNDREPIRDWRDMQRIKNELCGPECEGVELYPAESRRVDLANQFHLWVMPPGMIIPLGFSRRATGTPEEAAEIGAKQRPRESDV